MRVSTGCWHWGKRDSPKSPKQSRKHPEEHELPPALPFKLGSQFANFSGQLLRAFADGIFNVFQRMVFVVRVREIFFHGHCLLTSQILNTLEQTSLYLRGLKVQLTGLYSDAQEGTQLKLDIGATLVHVNDVMAWVEAKLAGFKDAREQLGEQTAPDGATIN